jgi:hypothetical protein
MLSSFQFDDALGMQASAFSELFLGQASCFTQCAQSNAEARSAFHV